MRARQIDYTERSRGEYKERRERERRREWEEWAERDGVKRESDEGRHAACLSCPLSSSPLATINVAHALLSWTQNPTSRHQQFHSSPSLSFVALFGPDAALRGRVQSRAEVSGPLARPLNAPWEAQTKRGRFTTAPSGSVGLVLNVIQLLHFSHHSSSYTFGLAYALMFTPAPFQL